MSCLALLQGDLMPTSEQLVALIANAGIAACFNFWYVDICTHVLSSDYILFC